MNTLFPPTPARRHRPGSRPLNIPSQRTSVPRVNPQRIVSAGEGLSESTEDVKVSRATSDVINSGRPCPSPSRPTIGQQQQKAKGKARIVESNDFPKKASTPKRTIHDASDRHTKKESTVLQSMKVTLPGQYEKKLESLAISKGIQASETNKIEANTFDLSEHFDGDFDLYELDGDEDSCIFGQMPCERLKQPTDILKVGKSIVFSPYRPPYALSPDSNSTFGCFKAVIRVQNTGKLNVTYLVESCSLKMFRIHEAIGYICPESTKEIMVTTNPKHHYKYEDIAGSSFTVSGYPILFRSQLAPDKLDAVWNALSCQLLPGGNVEHHIIKWVHAKSDSMLDDYSILERIQFKSPHGNPPKIERLTVPAMSALEFHSIWNGENPHDKLLLTKFKIRQLERTVSGYKILLENEQELVRKIVVIGGLFMLIYLFLGCMVYLDFDAQKQKLGLPWYEQTYNTCVNGAGYIYETFTNMISLAFKSLYSVIFT